MLRHLKYPAPSTKIFEMGDKVKTYGTENSYITVKGSKILSEENSPKFYLVERRKSIWW